MFFQVLRHGGTDAGYAADGDVIDKTVGAGDDFAGAFGGRGRGDQPDQRQIVFVQRRFDFRDFLLGQVDDQQAVDPGFGAGGDGLFESFCQQDIVIGEQDHRRGVFFPQPGGHVDDLREGGAVAQGDLRGFLDHRAVRHRIGKRHAELDQVGAGFDEFADEPFALLHVRVSGGHVNDQPFVSLIECVCDIVFHDVTLPKSFCFTSQTFCMSLSPRPERQMMID